MGLIKTKGIVIGVANSADHDKVLTVLTPDLGKISVFCRGAKKNKNTLLNATEYLAFSELILYKSTNDHYSINSAEVIEVFYNLRIDIDKLNYATTVSKIIYDVTQENEPAGQVLSLFLNTLYVLSETDKNKDLILSIFELRLLAIIGFLPNVARCVHCGTPMLEDMNDFYFSIKEDGVKCEICQRLDKGIIHLSKTAFSALIYVLSCDSKKLFSFEIPQEAIDEIRILTKIYTMQKLEKEYSVMQY